ncbi:MAG: hypothetical protein AAFQ07_09720, partial [Chloroflexota bacterium]
MSKLALQQAKQYIAQQDYERARAIIENIDHPKRADWLQRIDVLERQQAVDVLPKPTNPHLWSWLSIIITPLISTLVLAWNWRRLKKPAWMWVTIFGWIVIVCGTVGSIVGSAFYGFTNNTNA